MRELIVCLYCMSGLLTDQSFDKYHITLMHPYYETMRKNTWIVISIDDPCTDKLLQPINTANKTELYRLMRVGNLI